MEKHFGMEANPTLLKTGNAGKGQGMRLEQAHYLAEVLNRKT